MKKGQAEREAFYAAVRRIEAEIKTLLLSQTMPMTLEERNDLECAEISVDVLITSYHDSSVEAIRQWKKELKGG